MAFRNNAWAKIWEIKNRGNFLVARMTTSYKVKGTDRYEQDFSGFVTFFNAAAEKAERLRGDERIRILECAVTTRYDEAAQKEYVNYAIYDFDFGDEETRTFSKTNKAQPAPQNYNEEDDDDSPF